MSVKVGEYTASEGCEFSLADANHDFHTIFKSNKIKDYVEQNIPNYSGLVCSALSEDAFVDKYALELGTHGSSGKTENKSKKTFIKEHLNENIKSRYEAFYIDRPQHKYDLDRSLLQECFRSAGLLDDIFFICDVAYANVREDLKFAKKEYSQTFYWVQNAQTLYDPAGKTTWHSDKPYFENESVDDEGNVIHTSSPDSTTRILSKNHFKDNHSRFVFCWQNARKSKITQYPKWSTDLFPTATTPYNYSSNIPELMLYTNKDLFLGIRANKENPNDYALHDAYLIITDPVKRGYYGYADKNLAAKGSGILSASELASYRAKGDELKKFVKFINESISATGQITPLFLDEVMNYSSIFQVLAKKVGDASQSISCCQKKINFQRFIDNEKGPKAPNNIMDFESNGNHAFVSFDRIAIFSALNFNAPIVIGNTQEGFTVFIQKELLNIHKQFDNFFKKDGDEYQLLNQLKTTIENENGKQTFFTLNEELLTEISNNKDSVKELILQACLNLNIIPNDDITYQIFLINYFNESNVLQIFSNISPDILNYSIQDYLKKIVKIYNDNLQKIKENNTLGIDFSDLIVIDETANILKLMTNINNNIIKILEKINTKYNEILRENNGDKSIQDYKDTYNYIDLPETHKTYVGILELLKKVEKLLIELSEYQKFLTVNNTSMKKIKEYQGVILPTVDLKSLNSENNKNNLGLLPKGIAKNIIGYTPYSYYLSNDRIVRNSDIFIERSTSIFGTTTSILQICNILNSEVLSNLKNKFVQTIYNVLDEITIKATANNNVSFISVINASKELLANLSILNPVIKVKDINVENINTFLPLLAVPASQEEEPTQQIVAVLDTTPPYASDASDASITTTKSKPKSKQNSKKNSKPANSQAVNSSSEIRDVLRDKKLLISTRSTLNFKDRVELIRNASDTIEFLFNKIGNDNEVEKTYLDQKIKIAYENEIFIKGFIGIFAFMSYVSITSGIEAPALFTTRGSGDQKKVLQNLFRMLYLNLDDNKVDPNPLENLEQIKNSIKTELPTFDFITYDELIDEQEKKLYIESLEGVKTKRQKVEIASYFNKYLSYCNEIKKALQLYENIDSEAEIPPDGKSDFSLYSFRKLLEMNIVTVHENKPLEGKFEGINANEINANLALLYYVENRMARKSNKPIPHPELIGLFSQLFVESGLYSQERMFRNGGKKIGGSGDGLFEVMYDLFISDEDISGEDIQLPDDVKKFYKYKNKKITLFDIYRMNSYLLLNMPTNLEIEASSFNFYPEEIKIYVKSLNKEFQREQQRQSQISQLGNLARGGPSTGRPFYDNQNLYEGPGFPERGFMPPAIGVRGGRTKKYKNKKTKKNKTKKIGGKTNKNKTKKHNKNRIKVTKKHT